MAKTKKCKYCNGTGKVWEGPFKEVKKPCKKCNGKGFK